MAASHRLRDRLRALFRNGAARLGRRAQHRQRAGAFRVDLPVEHQTITLVSDRPDGVPAYLVERIEVTATLCGARVTVVEDTTHRWVADLTGTPRAISATVTSLGRAALREGGKVEVTS